MRRASDVTAVVDVLPYLGPVFDYVVLDGRVCAHCMACGDRFDVIGRPARAITMWVDGHIARTHTEVAS